VDELTPGLRVDFGDGDAASGDTFRPVPVRNMSQDPSDEFESSRLS
jgi:hypothetical protein